MTPMTSSAPVTRDNMRVTLFMPVLNEIIGLRALLPQIRRSGSTKSSWWMEDRTTAAWN